MKTVSISVNAASAARAMVVVADKLARDGLDAKVLDAAPAPDQRPDDAVAIFVTSDPVRSTFLVSVQKGGVR